MTLFSFYSEFDHVSIHLEDTGPPAKHGGPFAVVFRHGLEAMDDANAAKRETFSTDAEARKRFFELVWFELCIESDTPSAPFVPSL